MRLLAVLPAAACALLCACASPPYMPYVVDIRDAPADVVSGKRALDCAVADAKTVQFCTDWNQAQAFARGYKQHPNVLDLALATANGGMSDIGLMPLSPLFPAAGAGQGLLNSGWSEFNVMKSNDNAIVWNFLHDKGLARTIRGEPGAYLIAGPHP